MFKCPLCGNAYKEIEDLYLHIEEVHSEVIPEDYTPARYLYQLKTGKTHGTCVMCKKPTEWNERTNKYHRFCDNPKCKEQYREIFKERMIGKHGKVTLLDDPEHQKKMLANRRISGTYNMNGKEIGYTGTYELDFLKMLDMVLDWDENDIISPSPHTYWYEYDGRRHFYIPDFYIPSLNLEVEIKDGGDNPNNHWKIQAVDKEKERLKDEVMKTGTTSYIKVVNKQYGGFFTLLNKAKQNFTNGMKEKPIILLESVEELTEIITESKTIKPLVKYGTIEPSQEGFVDRNGIWNSVVTKNGKVYRERCETLIIKNGKVYLYIKPNGGYAIPGGSTEPNKTVISQLQNECKEEARINIKNSRYIGSYERLYDKIPKWMVDLPIKYDGLLTHLYVSDYDSKYNGDIDEHDIDEKMIKRGKFYNIDEVYDMLSEQHKAALSEAMNTTESTEITTESIGDVSCKCKHCGSLIGFSEENKDRRCYDCGHNYITGKVLPTSNYSQLYHISTTNLDGAVLNPRIPSNYFTNNGFEDSKTRRVCFSTSVDGALSGLSQNIEGQEFYVHVPACKQKIYIPNTNQVPDVKITNEVWVSTPTRIRCVGKIKVGKAIGDDIMFKYGDNIAYNVRWNWRWIDKKKDFIMESTQKNEEYLKPVYILLTYTNSMMAKAIKLVTKQPYSHAGISLDSSLSHIFTYGRKNAEDRCQFTDENIFNGLLGENRDTVQYALYVTFFNNRQLKILTQHIENIKNDISKHKYSYKGLINFALGKETHDDRMFCSQFVASVIRAGDPNRLKRDISLYSPTDLRKVSGMHFVTRGILGNYNKANVDDIVKKIKDRISLDSSNIMFESVMPTFNEQLFSMQDNIVEFASIVNECTDIDVLVGTLSYLDNDFCKPIIQNRLRNITTESITREPESNMYILLETTQNRLVNDKIIAFNPSDKETKLYTVTVENTDSRRDFHVNKYGKIGTSLVLEDTDIDIPDDNDKVYICFDVKTHTSNIQSIIESITEARLSPTAHAGIILDLNNDKLLTDYITSVLESIGVQGMEIQRFK